MPSNHFSRCHNGIRQGVWTLVSGKGRRGIQDQMDVLKALFAQSRSIQSLPSEKPAVSLVSPRPGTVTAAKGNFTSSHTESIIAEYHSSSSYGEKCFDNYQKASTSWRKRGHPNNFSIYRHYMTNVSNRNYFIGFGCKGQQLLSSISYSSSAAHCVSVDNSTKERQHLSSMDQPEQNISFSQTLKLNSGSCYLPHPDKEETGGEDAHFICAGEHTIGVADGVGGWADFGVDAGKYSRELMSNSVNAIQEEPMGSVDPGRVLERAYNLTKAQGSSTACIIALTYKGLHAINLGDSGFMVVRDGTTVFRSPIQQHDFNFTYQLETGNTGDPPGSGQVFTIPVDPGDVIIAGTDGLFDNLYNNEITAVVVQSVRAGYEPQVTAQKMAELAQQRARDKNRQTPFSKAAQEAGFRYHGGKLDDITVIVSYVASDENESLSANRSD